MYVLVLNKKFPERHILENSTASLRSGGIGVRGGEEEARATQESRGRPGQGVGKGCPSHHRSKSDVVKRWLLELR
jgi:hypothetical protein